MRGASIAAGKSKKAPAWLAGAKLLSLKTISKPTHSFAGLLHRLDGLGTILIWPARQKRGPSWDA
jgi:hypothetical protein